MRNFRHLEIKIVVQIATIGILSVGCTSISVQPLEFSPRPQHVCIEYNEKVLVQDFVAVLEEGIARHNMTTKVYSSDLPEDCDLQMRYTALRSWDFAPYLAKAELWLERDGQQVGYAEYHLVGGGGLSLMKWQGTKTKMDPVIDQLFAN